MPAWPPARTSGTSRAAVPTLLVLGFGNVGERAVAEGIATVGSLLTGSSQGAGLWAAPPEL
ncbi:hypothetical protein AB0K09_27955 [Streptomyces sp. NPDC049577]|uniref:hypothetical protein n=1 Tax=Streptomyces sp. NPDC049577 TaxID=3155153 RepID=UPI003437BE1E